MRRLVSLGWLPILAISCTKSDVYTTTGEEPFRPDRIAVTGRLCTEDTAGTSFPVKVLVMVDTSTQMFLADPEGYRLCGPNQGSCAPGSVGGLLQRTLRQSNVSLGFAGIGSVSTPLLPVPQSLCPAPCDAQQFFRPQDIDLGQIQAGLGLPTGSERNIINAVAQAESFISADLAHSSTGEVLRSRYIVFMLLAGPPTGRPPPDAAQLGEAVGNLKRFVYSRGALEFRMNVGLLYFGEKSIEPSGEPDNGYACHSPIGDACGCGGCDTGTPPYCEACCAVVAGPPTQWPWSTWDEWNAEARDAYSGMVFEGDGLFREHPCPATIEFRMDSATTSIELRRKDIVAYNINSRLGEDGPVVDSDGDGLSDEEELAATPATDPYHWDTDGDGLSDRLEFRAFPRQDPTDPTDLPEACADLFEGGILRDDDWDLLNNCEEGLLQTNPSIPDTDGDGLPDALEFMSGTVPTSAEDRLLDFDGDGISNAQEVLEHTNPRSNDGFLRGAEAYRINIVDLGPRTVATMEDKREFQGGITFRSADPNVAGGPAVLHWTPGDPGTLDWCDARIEQQPFVPEPMDIDPEAAQEYTLCCQNSANGEQACVVVFVIPQLLATLPDMEVTAMITTSQRNCYDVRMSNIKLVQTQPAEGILHYGSSHEEGTNHILFFFTQAPADRMDSPGLSKVAEIPVTFMCDDPQDIDTCARFPEEGFVELTDADFTAVVP